MRERLSDEYNSSPSPCTWFIGGFSKIPSQRLHCMHAGLAPTPNESPTRQPVPNRTRVTGQGPRRGPESLGRGHLSTSRSAVSLAAAATKHTPPLPLPLPLRSLLTGAPRPLHLKTPVRSTVFTISTASAATSRSAPPTARSLPFPTTPTSSSNLITRGHGHQPSYTNSALPKQHFPVLAAELLQSAEEPMAVVAAVLVLLPLLLAPSASAAGGGGCGAQAFSANRAYAACSDLPHLGASVHWTYDRAAAELSVAFVAAPAAPGGWVAWALNPAGEGMPGAQALVAAPSSSSGGAWAVQTYNISGYALGEPGPIAFPASDLAAELGGDGRVRVFGRLKLGHGAGVLNQVWQVGSAVSSGSPAPHAMGGDNLAAKAKLDLLRETTAAGGDSLAKKRNIHGVLNAVSWGILLPMGAIFARYLKTFKSADPAWFYLHVTCQLIGYVVGVSGWATGINLGKESKGVTYTLHRNIGITVFALGTLQIFALFLRPKKDHKYRLYWNMYHHSVGYTVIILGIINIFKGMTILDIEQRWKAAYIVAICVLGGVAVILEAVTWSMVVKRRKAENKTFNSASNGHLPHAV